MIGFVSPLRHTERLCWGCVWHESRSLACGMMSLGTELLFSQENFLIKTFCFLGEACCSHGAIKLFKGMCMVLELYFVITIPPLIFIAAGAA